MNTFAIRLACLLALLAAAVQQTACAGEGWNGCYLGGNAGYGWADIGGHDVFLNKDVGSATATGGLLGGQAGCDRQVAAWVFGAQASFALGALKGRHLFKNGSGPNDWVTYRVKSLATLTGRIGYAPASGTLVYLKLGGAWTRTDHDDSDPAPLGGPAYTGHREATRAGALVGLGLERRIGDRLTAFVEFSHMDFGRQTVRIPYSDGTAFDYDFRQRLDYLGVGANLRF